MNDFIVTSLSYNGKPYTAAAFFEERSLTELQVEQAGHRSYVGCVYCGRVHSVAKGIDGCFISIGKMGEAVNKGVSKESSALKKADCLYLRVRKHRNPQVGEKVLVQVTKDAAGTKVAECTEDVRLAGKYLVLGAGSGKVSFSRKLTDEQRMIIRKWISDEKNECESFPYSILVRSNAVHAKKAEFLQELAQMQEKLSRILTEYRGIKGPDKLYEPDPFYCIMERDLYMRPDRLFTDTPVIAEKDPRYELRTPIGYDLPLAEQYNLTNRIDRLLEKKVPLEGGGFIVIEQTEAFVSIDVNSGTFTKSGNAEETHRRVNLTAAKAIAVELRLRNLSGMILVDFINLSNPDHKQELIDTMRKLVKKDHVPTEVVDLTALGIMEIVREKHRKPLAEVFA